MLLTIQQIATLT